ncbi:MAG: hypothetical protein ABIN41_00500 [Devosia sp.]
MTDAVGTFTRELLPPLAGTVPVIHLGEVDCGFVIWWRAAKYGEPVDHQLKVAIEAQLAFVDTLLSAGYSTVVLTAPSPPTIREGIDWGDVANLRREVNVPLKQRTALALEYAQRIGEGAALRGLPYIDFLSITLDPSTGVLLDDFRHPDPRDHHLHPDRMATVWAGALNALAD